MDANTALIWLFALPVVASPAIYLLGRAGIAQGRRVPLAIARWSALLVLLADFYPLYFAGRSYLAGNLVSATIGTVTVALDGIALLVAAVTLTLGSMVTLFSTTYMAGEDGEEKFYALLSAMIGAIIGLACATDLFNMWVWFELMAITSYMLVAFYRKQPGALEAGVKYLVQSAVGSALVVVGIALVFMFTGRLEMEAIHMLVWKHPLLLAGGALMLVGFGVKAALVPLHTWLPDAHSQAPSGISAMLSGIVIEAGLVALLRGLGCLTNVSTLWGPLLLGLGALNMLVGNLMALRQTQVKRLLAFSSVAQVGYILLGLGAAIYMHQAMGAAGAFFHLITHALMKGLAFLAAGALLYSLHMARGSHATLTVEDLDGAARRYPATAFALSIAVLALGGLPPLAGFMSKWQIFVAGFQTGNAWIIALVIFAALNSVLSLAYYAPLVNRMYRNEPSLAVQGGQPVTFALWLPLLLLTAAIVLIGFWPSLLSWLTNPAATSLLTTFGGF